MKKYELTSEYIEVLGKKLFRIRALRDFGNVKTGDLGGYIEKEENLSHKGKAWVYGNAWVFGNARVYDDARVYGNAWVYDDASVYDDARVYGDADISKPTDLIAIGAIGSRNDDTTFFRNKDNKIIVDCGCFNGTIEEFEKAVEENHVGTKHERTYKLAIELAKTQIEL